MTGYDEQVRQQLADARTALAAAQAELAQLHAGEQPYEDGHLSPTPAQWIWHWNRATPEERLSMAAYRVDLLNRFHRCVNGAHEARLAERQDGFVAEQQRAEQAEARIAAVYAALAKLEAENGYGGYGDGIWRATTKVRAALDIPAGHSACCACGTNDATYFNHLGLAFCPACADCQCGQDPCVRTGGPGTESAADLHARSAHPGWEYATTEGPRKQWDDADVPPEGAGWTRNVDKGRDGWERWDYTEESYWRRPIPVDGSS